MAIEVKEITDYFGLPAEVDSMDKFKEKFESGFIKRDPFEIQRDKDLMSKVVGASVGGAKRSIIREAKQAGIEMTEDELAGKNMNEIIDFALPKIFTPLSEKLKTLSESAGKGDDVKVKEVQTAFDAYKAKAEPIITGYEALKTEHETFKQTVETEKVTGKIKAYKETALNDFKWAAGADQYTKKGFISEVESKVKFALDEKGEVWPVDESGNKFKDTSKAGAFKTFAQILEEEGAAANAKGAKILSMAAAGGKQLVEKKKLSPDNKDEPTVTTGRPRVVNTAMRDKLKV
jgi:hypothetical protein